MSGDIHIIKYLRKKPVGKITLGMRMEPERLIIRADLINLPSRGKSFWNRPRRHGNTTMRAIVS